MLSLLLYFKKAHIVGDLSLYFSPLICDFQVIFSTQAINHTSIFLLILNQTSHLRYSLVNQFTAR
ncbi:MAG: hypothetical protein LBQ24_03200 [Candidatus Peribacteria bacterium]|nr:hypothetical protein [Candidatus Peribacteria bacterium]